MKPSKGYSLKECGGMRRYGGAFSFGPVQWVKCDQKPTVVIQIKQEEGLVENVPACTQCWKECIDKKMNILKVEPIIQNEETKKDNGSIHPRKRKGNAR